MFAPHSRQVRARTAATTTTTVRPERGDRERLQNTADRKQVSARESGVATRWHVEAQGVVQGRLNWYDWLLREATQGGEGALEYLSCHHENASVSLLCCCEPNDLVT